MQTVSNVKRGVRRLVRVMDRYLQKIDDWSAAHSSSALPPLNEEYPFHDPHRPQRLPAAYPYLESRIALKDTPQVRIYPDSPYERIFTSAAYAPWNIDTFFIACYETILGGFRSASCSTSLKDKFRLFDLYALVHQSGKLAPGSILEVGTWRGGSGFLMAATAHASGSPGMIYLCDTFEGVVKASARDSHYKSGEHSDADTTSVERLMQTRNLANYKILRGIFPDDTAHLIPSDETFRLSHIDVDVYESAKQTFDYVWPKTVPGGLVVFDDYGFMGCNGVTDFVNELKDRDDLIFFYKLNGHAVVQKRH